MSYEPRGKMIDFMAALRKEPTRLFTMADVAAILQCKPYPSTIDQYLYSVIRAGLTFRINLRGEWLYAGREINDELLIASGRAPRSNSDVRIMPSPFTDEDRKRASADPRATKVDPTWSPPKMIVTRPGAAPVERTLEQEDEELRARINGANDSLNEKLRAHKPDETRDTQLRPCPDCRDEAACTVARKCAHLEALPHESDAREASGGSAQPDEEVEEVPFNAALWLDGDLDLYGLIETEDGAQRVPAEQVAKLRKLLAWMPA